MKRKITVFFGPPPKQIVPSQPASRNISIDATQPITTSLPSNVPPSFTLSDSQTNDVGQIEWTKMSDMEKVSFLKTP